MGLKGLAARRFCVAIIVALVLACATAFAFVFVSTKTADAEESPNVQATELGEIGVTYIIGEKSIIGKFGAMEVDGNSKQYGYYIVEENNGEYEYTYSNHAVGWAKAMQAARVDCVKVALADDWTATETADGDKIFGSDPTAFDNGSILVPSGATVVLDLNGCVIDRANGNGRAVMVGNEAALELVDGKPDKEHKAADGITDRFTYERIVTEQDGTGEAENVTRTEVITGGVITGGNAVADTESHYSYAGGVYVGELSTFIMNGGAICDNKASNVGGGIYVYNLSTFIMNGGAVCNNTANFGGGIFLYTFNTVTINNGAICDNYAAAGAGAIYADNRSWTVMNGGVVNNNSSAYVGGVYLQNTDFTMNGGEISNNISSSSGGGLTLYNASFTINDGVIRYNKAEENDGGGIHASNSTVNVKGGSVSNNTASGKGGGIYASNNSTVNIKGGVISNNKASIYGGGINVGGSTIIMEGGEISGNTVNANGYGGGVCLYNNNKFTMRGGVISGNTAGYGGGVHVGGDTTFNMIGGEIRDNITQVNKGGVYTYGTNTIVLGGKAVIKNNKYNGTIEKNLQLNNSSPITVGAAFEAGAEIWVTPYKAAEKTTGYAKNNSENGVVADPSKYFYSDDESKNVLLLNDEVYFMTKEKGALKAVYGEADAEPIEVDGYGAEYEYEKNSAVKYELTVGGEVKTLTVTKWQSNGSYTAYSGAMTDVGTYKLTYADGSYRHDYYITILPRDLTDETVGATLNVTEYEYDGEAKEPSVSEVTYNGATLTAETDYEITYRNNMDAGTGYAVITFKGNYTGSKELPFEINIAGGQYTVTWEYFDGTAWKDVDAATAFEYVPGYRGNQSNRVRAKLTLKGADESGEVIRYAYASGVTDYNDVTVTTGNVSEITVKYEQNGESVSAFREVGAYAAWLDGEADYPIGGEHRITLGIDKYEIDPTDTRLELRLSETEVIYDGTSKRPSVRVVLDYLALYEGIDYTVNYSDEKHEDEAIEGGAAKATITFIGNYSGEAEIAFEIARAVNGWEKLPNIVRWTYGNFDEKGAVIIAKPKYLLPEANVHISILNGNGEDIDGLADIAVEKIIDQTYGECYVVSDEETVTLINTLGVTRYILRVWVDGTSSYSELSDEEIMFNILKAENYWEESPSIESWITGNYDKDKNAPQSKSKFGEQVIVKITDETGECVYYDNSTGVDTLSGMRAGLYIMTAQVSGTDDYSALNYSTTFRVFAPESNTVITQGMPWWGVLLIVIGVVAVIVIVMLVLHIKGVLQLLTGKMVIRIRAKADVDATIAAVRAGRMAAAAQSAESTATMTEKEEKKTIKKAENLEKKAKTPEEKAAELEAKAKAMRKKAEAMKAKAKVIVMTPEEKKAMKQEEKEREKEKNRVKSPEERAEALEKKAEQNEAQAEQLKAKAEIMKNRANEMREKAAKKKEKPQPPQTTETTTQTEEE